MEFDLQDIMQQPGASLSTCFWQSLLVSRTRIKVKSAVQTSFGKTPVMYPADRSNSMVQQHDQHYKHEQPVL